jgi:hypothetical protein
MKISSFFSTALALSLFCAGCNAPDTPATSASVGSSAQTTGATTPAKWDGTKLSSDDKHKLLQAASRTHDAEVISGVIEAVGLHGHKQAYDHFLGEHLPWARKNLAFVRSVSSPKTARQYLAQHIPASSGLLQTRIAAQGQPKPLTRAQRDAHMLLQAAAILKDADAIVRVEDKLGIGDMDSAAHKEFMAAHTQWAIDYAADIDLVTGADNARKYLNAHGETP